MKTHEEDSHVRGWVYRVKDFCPTKGVLVSFAAVIRVVMHRSSPLVSGEEHCVTTLITAAKKTKGVQDEMQLF